jgi:hypothetical protein
MDGEEAMIQNFHFHSPYGTTSLVNPAFGDRSPVVRNPFCERAFLLRLVPCVHLHHVLSKGSVGCCDQMGSQNS